MDKDKLKKLIEDDELGLLEVKEKAANLTPNERLANSFLEIVNFIDKNNRPPEANSSDISEYKLYSRLKSINNDPEKIEKLLDFDKHNILKEEKAIKSVAEIIEDDDLGLLKDEVDLFDLKNVPKRENFPDYIGRQKPCKDFEKFEPLFQSCQLDLKNEKRKLFKLKSEKQIKKDRFYIIRGVMVYVAEVGDIKEVSKSQKNRANINARLRLIYENGTESDILLRSLARALYEDGYIVTENADETEYIFDIGEDDKVTGFIYILQTLSDKQEVTEIENLYKIGYSTQPVEERIKHAKTDPTYLMAPVKVVASFRCYNLNPQKFEHLLHRFFAKARIDAEIINSKSEKYIPGEWFSVPIGVIEQAIQLIINGEIVHYRYDHIEEAIAEIEDLDDVMRKSE